MKSYHRDGSMLIVVVGMVGIMAALCLTFLSRSRGEANEMAALNRVVQARICMAAACTYVLESGRIGWDDPATPTIHEEAFGWVDVRDGQVGPRTQVLLSSATYSGGVLVSPDVYQGVVPAAAVDAAGRPQWPLIGGISRHPMYRMQRPPFAISPDVTPNVIENDPAKPLFGLPLLRKPDPQPLVSTSYIDFRDGIPAAISSSVGQGWFRLLRDGPATFIVTVGSGATQGFRDWAEVVALGQTGLFVGGQPTFEYLLSEEVRLWFRIEWSSAVSIEVNRAAISDRQEPGRARAIDWGSDHSDWPMQDKNGIAQPWSTYANQGGTIQWIQRLRAPPEVW